MANHYFKSLPDIQYRNPLKTSNTLDNYVTAKNLFVRAKVRDDIIPSITFLRSYTIEDGERPQDVAERLYGDPLYDWVVLITANIINVRQDWPMSSRNLYNYSVNKYGGDLNATRNYETVEVKDKSGRLVLPAGLSVDKNFSIPDPDSFNITLNPVLGITNFLAETRLNEKKRNIKLMRKEFLTQFLLDHKNAVEYKPSSQFKSRTLKQATG
tara:strand:- start:11570 stop:12205 length:636 start_codon:yes stop_codon:yes gene_type:complete